MSEPTNESYRLPLGRAANASDLACPPDGLHATIRRSKTDQEGQGAG